MRSPWTMIAQSRLQIDHGEDQSLVVDPLEPPHILLVEPRDDFDALSIDVQHRETPSSAGGHERADVLARWRQLERRVVGIFEKRLGIDGRSRLCRDKSGDQERDDNGNGAQAAGKRDYGGEAPVQIFGARWRAAFSECYRAR